MQAPPSFWSRPLRFRAAALLLLLLLLLLAVCVWFDFCCSVSFTVTEQTTNGCGLFKLIEMSCKLHRRFKYAVSLFSCRRSSVSDAALATCVCVCVCVCGGGLESWGHLQDYASYTFRRCRVVVAENHHANPVIWPPFRGSGPPPPPPPPHPINIFTPFMDICFTSCCHGAKALPSSRHTAS